MTEQELIDGLKCMNEVAIGYLVGNYQNNISKTAYHFVNNREDAEDITQEVLLEVLRSIGRFRSNAALSTWIYRITVNRSLDFLRKQKNKKMFLRLETILGLNSVKDPPETLLTEDQQLEKENRMVLDKAVNELPGNQKIAFVLSKYDELSCREIADIMNLSLSSVESLVHRAKLNLQKKLVFHFTEYANKES
ncbi:MAG: RNA polymerase sigma factor [Bacteroidota bacterium]|nr:RNA polymerase sigma factor [Bacteroidota bacterium]